MKGVGTGAVSDQSSGRALHVFCIRKGIIKAFLLHAPFIEQATKSSANIFISNFSPSQARLPAFPISASFGLRPTPSNNFNLALISATATSALLTSKHV